MGRIPRRIRAAGEEQAGMPELQGGGELRCEEVHEIWRMGGREADPQAGCTSWDGGEADGGDKKAGLLKLCGSGKCGFIAS